ncbi:MAG: CPBP family glutamic-type intramembrane protease, partial [Myxococcaceae bacterium]
LLSGVLLYAGSRLVLWLMCGGATRILCGPLEEVFTRFQTRGPGPALVLVLIIAPAEELFWRGLVQERLRARVSPALAVGLTAVLSALLLALFGQWLLALAALPTALIWGGLKQWRGSLVPAIVSHATWDLLIAVLVPP